MVESAAPEAEGERVAAVRRFNRLYTQRIGALDRAHLRSPYSLAEVRVLYELAHWPEARREPPTATAVGRALGLDPGYLSRLLRGFERAALIARVPAPDDGRQQLLRLSDAGRATVADLEERARADVAALLAPLGEPAQRRLLGAMSAIETVLATPHGPASDRARSDARGRPAVRLRPPRPGDLGWVVARHGALYAQEYGWDVRFEALVARIVADFADEHDPERERCWIAEADGGGGPEPVGSVFLVRHPEREGVARLRLLLVEPGARGLGVGRRLVAECTWFARQAGYRAITLWTNSVLVAARRLYEAEGYRLVEESPHRRFGPELVGQTWELAL